MPERPRCCTCWKTIDWVCFSPRYIRVSKSTVGRLFFSWKLIFNDVQPRRNWILAMCDSPLMIWGVINKVRSSVLSFACSFLATMTYWMISSSFVAWLFPWSVFHCVLGGFGGSGTICGKQGGTGCMPLELKQSLVFNLLFYLGVVTNSWIGHDALLGAGQQNWCTGGSVWRWTSLPFGIASDYGERQSSIASQC